MTVLGYSPALDFFLIESFLCLSLSISKRIRLMILPEKGASILMAGRNSFAVSLLSSRYFPLFPRNFRASSGGDDFSGTCQARSLPLFLFPLVPGPFFPPPTRPGEKCWVAVILYLEESNSLTGEGKVGVSKRPFPKASPPCALSLLYKSCCVWNFCAAPRNSF